MKRAHHPACECVTCVRKKLAAKRKRKPEPAERCQFCGLDPTLHENRGRQIYICDKCEALVCSQCSENGAEDERQIFCSPCTYELNQLGAEQRGER